MVLQDDAVRVFGKAKKASSESSQAVDRARCVQDPVTKLRHQILELYSPFKTDCPVIKGVKSVFPRISDDASRWLDFLRGLGETRMYAARKVSPFY